MEKSSTKWHDHICRFAGHSSRYQLMLSVVLNVSSHSYSGFHFYGFRLPIYVYSWTLRPSFLLIYCILHEFIILLLHGNIQNNFMLCILLGIWIVPMTGHILFPTLVLKQIEGNLKQCNTYYEYVIMLIIMKNNREICCDGLWLTFLQ